MAQVGRQQPVGERDLLVAGERSLWVDGDLATSREQFADALRQAELSGDTTARATAALGMTGLWADHRRETAESDLARRRLRSALAGVEQSSPAGLRLQTRLAADAIDEPDRQSAVLTAAERALRSGHAVAAAEALNLAHQCLRGPACRSERRRLTSELVALGPRTGRRGDLLLGRLWQVVDGLLDGDTSARADLLGLRRSLAHRPFPAVDLVVQAIDGMLHGRAGRFGEAERVARECLTRGLRVDAPEAMSWYCAQLVAIRWFQGRIADLLPVLSGLAECPQASDTDLGPRAALALAAAAAGDRRQAADALTAFEGELDMLPRSGTGLATLSLVVEAAHLLGAQDLAARAHRALAPFAEYPATSGPGISCLGSAEQALGIAALTLGDSRQAAAHLRRAIERNRALGNRPAAALARRRLALALRPPRPAPSRVDPAPGLAPTTAGAHQPGGVTLTCRRSGRHWRLQLGRRSVLVDDIRGMTYLAVLIGHPHREFACTDLSSVVNADEAPRGAAPAAAPDGSVTERFRARLVQLQQEIERCDEIGDRDASVRAHDAWDRALAELNSITATSGRDRDLPADADRDRIAVGRAVRRALKRIEQADQDVGRALTAAIRLGKTCAYVPPAADDVEPSPPDVTASRPAEGFPPPATHVEPPGYRLAGAGTPVACRVGSCLCARAVADGDAVPDPAPPDPADRDGTPWNAVPDVQP